MSSSTQTAIAITMPRLSDSMEEATILAWLKAPGDAVARGDELVEIETDKATMVYEAEQDGVLGELLVGEGEVAALGAPIAQLLVEGAPASPAPASAAPGPSAGAPAAGAPEPTVAAAPAPAAAGAAAVPSAAAAPVPAGARMRATPIARRVAAELGVALETLTGSGPRGRIVRADVRAASERRPVAGAGVGERPAAPPAAAGPDDERIELTSTQRTIARRMVASRTEVPEFTLTAEIDMTDALALRRQLVALRAEEKVSVNDMVVKAAALVLREQPAMNASWGGDHIVRHGHVNVGIAVATEGALLVPVVRDADRKPLSEVAREARALGTRARERSATPAELSGGTFTVTNLGMYGVLSFDAVIDAPQAAILAVGASVRRPAYDALGVVVARDLMHVSLSCDHRVVYGADGARFLERLRDVLEHPMTLLMPPVGGPNEGDGR